MRKPSFVIALSLFATFCLGYLFFVVGLRIYDRSLPQPLPPIAKLPKTIVAKVTGYDSDWRCTGKWSKYQKTTTGTDAKKTDGVAAAFELLPPKTRLYIPGVGIRVVDDTGGAMRKSAKRGIYHIDVRLKDHKHAKEFAVKQLLVFPLRSR